MSQAKVDQYKKEKANRKQNMRREKISRMIYMVIAAVIAAAILVWVGYSVYNSFNSSSDTENSSAVEVNTDAVDDYLNGLGDTE